MDRVRAGGVGLAVLGVCAGLAGFFGYAIATMCITSAPTDCSGAPLSPFAVAAAVSMIAALPLLIAGIVMIVVGAPKTRDGLGATQL